jgi:hypothetical protein
MELPRTPTAKPLVVVARPRTPFPSVAVTSPTTPEPLDVLVTPYTPYVLPEADNPMLPPLSVKPVPLPVQLVPQWLWSLRAAVVALPVPEKFTFKVQSGSCIHGGDIPPTASPTDIIIAAFPDLGAVIPLRNL